MKNEGFEMKNDDTEKQKKAGNPILILFIFLCLIGFIFFVPEIYHKYNSDIADFLGIGSNKNENESTSNEEEENKAANSAHYQIGSNSTFSFNELEFSNISLSSDRTTLSMKITSKENIDLESLNYYVEFYNNRTTFVGRRSLLGKVNGSTTIELDVSSLGIDTVTYLVISHIDDNAVQALEPTTDESGLSSFSCTYKDYNYTYDFYLSKLIKVTEKYSYRSTDVDEYAENLLTYQKKAKDLNTLNGINATVAENNSSFIFIAEYDYSEVNEFTTIDDRHLFSKNALNNIIKFKMEAEGYDCE